VSPQRPPPGTDEYAGKSDDWSFSSLRHADFVSREPLLFRNGNPGRYLPEDRRFKRVSIEPLLFRNGNIGMESSVQTDIDLFQLSHFFSEMEIFQQWKFASINDGGFRKTNQSKYLYTMNTII